MRLVHHLVNQFSLSLPKALPMWAIGVMSGVLVGNLVRRLDQGSAIAPSDRLLFPRVL
ncbi:hypothetical protein [Nostoc sp. CALU 1950]|uniref:hypothetical protein n=1 Tax=Nostoc sp. CALU 1950 TaxID=3104321 RepID=UPI003EB76633